MSYEFTYDPTVVKITDAEGKTEIAQADMVIPMKEKAAQKITVKAAGNANYNAGTKTVQVTIRVK